MKNQKLMRSFLMAALLFGGIFVIGMDSNVYASGYMASGTRSQSAATTNDTTPQSSTDTLSTDNRSVIGSGGFTEPVDESNGGETLLEMILNYLF